MSEWRKMEWPMDEQEWWAIANSRRQIEQSWLSSAQLPVTNYCRAVRIDPAAVPRVPRRSVEPIGIQPWQADVSQQRLRHRASLPLKRPQVELPQFATRR
ncbi:hypothetical protein RYO59_001429 [Thermosynechococcaceae cyanobacterium Okahandja]